MAVYTNDLRLKEIATGDESGTWGTSTNTNLSLIADAFGFGTEAITTNADTHTTTIADGSADPGRSIFLKYTGTLDSACTITIGPNTVSKLWFIENATSGSQNIIIKQGSGATVTIANGQTKAIYSDGAGSGGAMVDAFTDLSVPSFFVSGDLDVDGTTNLDVVDIDGAVDMASTLTVGGNVTINSTTLKLSGSFPQLFFEDTAGSDLDAYIVNNANGFFIGKTNSPSSSNDILSLDLTNQTVGIGGTPTKPLTVFTSAASDSARFTDNTNSELLIEHAAGNLLTLATGSTSQPFAFAQGSTEAMRISGGNFIVGGTSDGAAGSVTLQSDGDIRGVLSSSAGGDTILSAISGVSNGYQISVDTSNNQTYKWFNGSSQSMTLNSSGNLLVGTTTADGGFDESDGGASTVFMGASIGGASSGSAFVSRRAAPLQLNRQANDGDIAVFRKNGSVVGSIGTEGGDMAIGNDDAGIQFVNGTEHFRPFSMASNAATDDLMNIGSSSKRFNEIFLSNGINNGTNAIAFSGGAFAGNGSGNDANIDLGRTNRRFQNLYLSGGVFLGGTGSDNELDDYEEGTATLATSDYVLSSQSVSYQKIGNTVHLRGRVVFSTVGSNTSSVVFSGAPFPGISGQAHGVGVARETTTFGDIFVCQLSSGTSNFAINSMDGVVSGSHQTFSTSKNYDFSVTYRTT